MRIIMSLSLIASIALGCNSGDGPTGTNPQVLSGTWVVGANEIEIWVMHDNGVFSSISPLDNQCMQVNGSWQSDDDYLWITLQDETIKKSYSLVGEKLSITNNGEQAKEFSRSDKDPFELMILAGHCTSNTTGSSVDVGQD
jgi:hypothetical protein